SLAGSGSSLFAATNTATTHNTKAIVGQIGSAAVGSITTPAGVAGLANTGNGVYGTSLAAGAGVYGSGYAGSYGVWGITHNTSGYGVVANVGSGITGATALYAANGNTSGRAASITLTDATNASNAMEVSTAGTGEAGKFTINNASNNDDA